MKKYHKHTWKKWRPFSFPFESSRFVHWTTQQARTIALCLLWLKRKKSGFSKKKVALRKCLCACAKSSPAVIVKGLNKPKVILKIFCCVKQIKINIEVMSVYYHAILVFSNVIWVIPVVSKFRDMPTRTSFVVETTACVLPENPQKVPSWAKHHKIFTETYV